MNKQIHLILALTFSMIYSLGFSQNMKVWERDQKIIDLVESTGLTYEVLPNNNISVSVITNNDVRGREITDVSINAWVKSYPKNGNSFKRRNVGQVFATLSKKLYEENKDKAADQLKILLNLNNLWNIGNISLIDLDNEDKYYFSYTIQVEEYPSSEELKAVIEIVANQLVMLKVGFVDMGPFNSID